MKSLLKKIGGVVLFLLLIFAIAELCFDVYILYFAGDEFVEKYASITQLCYLFRKEPNRFRITPHPFLGYFPTPNFERGCNKHNKYGFRGQNILEKEPGEIWIACIGESTTYDYKIECWEKAYPALLESFLQDKGLKAKVINAGVDGWTSYEIMLDFVLRTSKFPLDYVIYYGGFNDLIFNRLIYPVLNKGDQVLGGYGIKGGVERVLDIPLWQWSSLLRFLNVKFCFGIPHFDYFSVRPGENSRFFELIVQLINGSIPPAYLRIVHRKIF